MKKQSYSRVLSVLSFSAISFLTLLTACGGGVSTNSNNNNPPPPPPKLGQAAAAHHIKVGAAADSFYLPDASYSSVLGSEFTQLQAENEMKFSDLHPASGTYDFSGGDALVTFAQAHTMAVRGHTLVWHNQVPAWVTSGNYTSPQLSQILQDHITTVAGHYAGKVWAWDVVNEAFNDDGNSTTPSTLRSTLWYDNPGIGFAGQGTAYIEQTLNWAHTADPTAKLIYNDYNDETVGPKSDAIYLMAQDFTNRGVPLDGIGFQFHVDLNFDNPNALASVASNFQRFAALGLEIHITELDIRLSDGSTASLAAQAKLYGELAAICVQQPKCTVFQTWGLSDKYSWIPGFFPGMGWALLWDANYQKKPAYTSVLTAMQ